VGCMSYGKEEFEIFLFVFQPTHFVQEIMSHGIVH